MKFNEYSVEETVLEELEGNGWRVPGGTGSGSSAKVLDERYDRDRSEVVYWNLLRERIVEINEDVDDSEAKEVVGKLKRRLGGENLVEANQEFQELLRKGVQHTVDRNGESVTTYVDLVEAPDKAEIQREDLDENVFHAVNQFQVDRRASQRMDVSLLVNGVPIVHFELKKGTSDSDVEDAVSDLRGYESAEPRMFATSVLNAAGSAHSFRCAAVGSPRSLYFPWRSEEKDEMDLVNGIRSLMRPEVLVDVQRNFTFFQDETKVTPRYMQYRAANKIVGRVAGDDARKGLIWHTQGSGKSFTMLFAAQKLMRSKVTDRQILLVVDRNKLEDQMETDLEEVGIRHEVAGSVDDLNRILEEGEKKVVLTTIQKFEDANSEVNPNDTDPMVMVDECHRFMEKSLDNRLMAALPDAFYFGFTGTPVVEDGPEGRNTFDRFSPEGEQYLDRYSILEGQEDGVIVDVAFAQKKFEWEIPGEELDREYEQEFDELDPDQRRELIREHVDQATLAELRPRMEKVVDYIRRDYEQKLEGTPFKAMVVAPSRKAAALYCDEIRKYWDEEEAEAIISSSKGDEKFVRKYAHSSGEEREIVESFNSRGNPKVLFVCGKLLTGFDSPRLMTLYLDKSLKNHSLLQAIARTNRPRTGKSNGRIVDLQGVFSDMDKALEYSEELEVKENAVTEEEELAEEFVQLLRKTGEIFEADFDGSPESFHSCIAALQRDTDARSEFVSNFRRLENLYESLTPHEKLGMPENEELYETLAQIYYKFKASQRGDDPDDLTLDSSEVREKTERILEEHIDIQEKEESEVSYSIEEPELKTQSTSVEEDREPEYTVAVEGPALVDDIPAERNPAFSSLSERVENILQSWRKDEISSQKASNRIDEIETELQKVCDRKTEVGVSNAAFAVLELIEEDYREDFGSESELKEFINQLDDKLEQVEFGISYSEGKKEAERVLIESLNENGSLELAKTEFLDRATHYVMENRDKVQN